MGDMLMNRKDAAFAKLYAEMAGALRRYVRRFVRSREAADDIVHEAFLRTYEHGRETEGREGFLYTIARNLAMDSARHERVAKTQSIGDFEGSTVEPQSLPLEIRLIADEQSRLLKQAVERLPPQCRLVFVLKVFHAWSYREIAERLGISPKTVENHIANGLRETHRYMHRRYKEVDVP